MARSISLGLGLVLFAAALNAQASSATLDDVKARGHLLCGVNEGLPGFGAADEAGDWSGFDVDFCRAVAAAIFDDAQKVEFVPVALGDRFAALRDGKFDLLSRNSTWTMTRETDFGLTFVGVTYYDGQGFMVPRATGVLSSLELDGTKVCVQGNTTTAANLADYFSTNNMSYEPVFGANSAEALANYAEGKCNVLTSDMSQLHALRLELPDADEQLILADTISKEPLGPVVRQDDPAWATLVKWVQFALLNGEELGVGSDTIEEALTSDKPAVRRLVGTDGSLGKGLGLSEGWAASALRQVGNYGEIFRRNLGADSPLGIPRGMNQLWNRGGIQYAPPMN